MVVGEQELLSPSRCSVMVVRINFPRLGGSAQLGGTGAARHARITSDLQSGQSHPAISPISRQSLTVCLPHTAKRDNATTSLAIPIRSAACPRSSVFLSSSLSHQPQLHVASTHPTHVSLQHLQSTSKSIFDPEPPNNSKCHQRLRRPPPLAARPQLERHPRRRRRLARRLLPHLATRRSAPRRERRPTPPTSTRVRASSFDGAIAMLHRGRASPVLIRMQADTSASPQAGPPRHRYLQPCHVHPELLRQRYVFRLLAQHEPTLIANADIFERVATEASKLAAYNKKSTISSREIQTS